MLYTVVGLPLCCRVDIIKTLLNIALKSLWVRSRNGCNLNIGWSATFVIALIKDKVQEYKFPHKLVSCGLSPLYLKSV